jgi:hypothetical protein
MTNKIKRLLYRIKNIKVYAYKRHENYLFKCIDIIYIVSLHFLSSSIVVLFMCIKREQLINKGAATKLLSTILLFRLLSFFQKI